MIFALIGWLLATGAVAFGSYRLTRGNYYYVAAFTAMTFFAPPIGLGAFLLFTVLRMLMPPIKDIPVHDQDEETPAPERQPLQKNPHYTKQLEAAEAELDAYREALSGIEARITAIDSKSEGAVEQLKALEDEKAECAVKKIAAEEAYDRLRKLQH